MPLGARSKWRSRGEKAFTLAEFVDLAIHDKW
jgi:hypothetical protein